MVASFGTLLSRRSAPDRTIAIVDEGQPEPVLELFANAFGNLGLDLTETNVDIDTEDAVVLLEDENVVATSSMESIRKSLLLVNADLYRTGLSGIEKHHAPEILTELDDAVYTLRGFPESTKEKLLLVVISRHIERRALEAGDGRLDVAFQKLSRIEDEYGTKRVYERLSDTDVDVHIYGVPDSRPTDLAGLNIHTGRTEQYRSSWFVVFSPFDENVEPAALLAVETDSNVWRSMWTYDPDKIATIRRRIDRDF